MEKRQGKIFRRSISTAGAHDAASSSFFGPAVQTKLTVNQPGDRYEQEADAVADQVMRKPSSDSADISAAPAPLVSTIQRKCEACEQEELQRKEEGSEEDGKIMTKLAGDVPGIQRFSIDCTHFKKKDADIDAEDAAAEAAASPQGTAAPSGDAGEGGGGDDSGGEDGGAGDVQRKCADCEKEEVQRDSDTSGDASPSFESNLQASKGGGSSLPDESRSFFEDRFGADFSGVRIHNDSNSAAMSSSINAHAFTHGQDIYFNSGQYSGGESGQKLLAHELTHVVQQSGGSVQRKKQSAPEVESSHIQRSFYFTPSRPRVSGTAIHETVLPEFVKANADLFAEVSIPGANRKDVDKNKTGAADFYKGPRTIGIKFDGEPKKLNADRDFMVGSGTAIGGKNYRHNVHAAPIGDAYKPRIKNPDLASSEPQIGELKPAHSSESYAGQGQIQNYMTGITKTRDDVNSYLTADPTQTNSTKKSWTVSPVYMKTLNIPGDLNYISGTGIKTMRQRPLDMWREGDRKPHTEHVGFTGTLFVYKDKPEGVWSYEWIPDSIPATTGSKEANTIINRLNNEVIPALTATGGTSIAPKRAPAGYYVMRKDAKFSDEAWKKKHFTPWKSQSVKFLNDKSEVKKAEVAQGVTEVEKRSGKSLNTPQEVKNQGTNLPKVKHWKRFGGFYGWLREKFDTVYVKVKGFVNKIKKKVQDFAKKAGGTTFGSWFKAFAKVVFKIIKMVGSWVVTQVMDKLLNSLRQGIINNLNKLIEKLTPDEAKVYLEKFCALKDDYDKIIEKKEDELATLLFGDKLKLLETVEEVEKHVSLVGDIVTLIEWGIRLLACAAPPAIGCLWNLLIEAIKWAFAQLIQTCWFTKEVYAPVINKVDLVKKFPAEIASGLVTKFNEHLPVPEGLDKWFTPIDVSLTDFKVDCNDGGDGSGALTEDRKAIFDLVKPEGDEPAPQEGELTQTGKKDQKLKAALQLMKKRGAGPWVLLTKERAGELKSALENSDATEMLEAANDKSKPIPEGMQEMVKKVSTYTSKEERLRAEAKAAAYDKAEREAFEKAKAEIMKDPKAIAAMNAPYPPDSDLKKDLDGYTGWGHVTSDDPSFVRINGHTCVLFRTKKGARLGAFFKYYEKEESGVVRNITLETSDYYAVDDIEAPDSLSLIMVGREGSNTGSLIYISLQGSIPEKSMFELGNMFFNVSVTIQ